MAVYKADWDDEDSCWIVRNSTTGQKVSLPKMNRSQALLKSLELNDVQGP